MAILTYSLKSSGNTKVSENFKVKEFACPGSDVVKIDTLLVNILEDARSEFNRRYGDVYIRIGSGFRTVAYNTKIGGATGSKHTKGEAGDIDVVIRPTGGNVVDPEEVCKYFESKRVRGLGCYKYADGQSWTHVDSRTSKSFWRQSSTKTRISVETFWPTLKEEIVPEGGEYTVNEDVKVMQSKIGAKPDGKFGPKSAIQLAKWQLMNGLVADSICGPKTWNKIWG